jgi:protein phosphatase
MGTTLTAALIFGPDVHIVHIGDSRAYLRRGGRLQQLTTDHSVVGQMIASGQLTPAQARDFEHRNVLLQALGVQVAVSPELVIFSARAGDVLVLCSDGLTGPLEDATVLDILLRHDDPMRAARALTEAACAAGGPDNVTVALVRFVGADLPAPDDAPIQFHRAQHTVQ